MQVDFDRECPVDADSFRVQQGLWDAEIDPQIS